GGATRRKTVETDRGPYSSAARRAAQDDGLHRQSSAAQCSRRAAHAHRRVRGLRSRAIRERRPGGDRVRGPGVVATAVVPKTAVTQPTTRPTVATVAVVAAGCAALAARPLLFDTVHHPLAITLVLFGALLAVGVMWPVAGVTRRESLT